MIDIKYEAHLIKDQVIAWRRHLHQYPELGMEEFETSKYIKSILKAYGIGYLEVGETGIVADIAKDRDDIIALRADMDALSIQENNKGIDYKSKNKGIMHACGHDAHMASLLGAAVILKKYESELTHCVRLIFQPAEEICKGSKLMIENGAIDGVSEIYGVHVFSDLPARKISIESGPRMATTDIFRIDIYGKASHRAKPHQGIDATIAAAACLLNLQTLVSRELDPTESALVSIGQMHSGSQYNIISDHAMLEGTARTFSNDTATHVHEAIKRIITNTCASYRAKAVFDFKVSKHPVVFNDEALTNKMQNRVEKLFGKEQMIHVAPMMLGEDFASYQTKIPGVFAFVGGYNPEKNCIYPNHHDCFNIDEDILEDCVALYTLFGM